MIDQFALNEAERWIDRIPTVPKLNTEIPDPDARLANARKHTVEERQRAIDTLRELIAQARK